MSVRYALMGLLREQTDYGYHLKQRFDDRVGNAWRLNLGQVEGRAEHRDQVSPRRVASDRDPVWVEPILVGVGAKVGEGAEAVTGLHYKRSGARLVSGVGESRGISELGDCLSKLA